MHSLQVNKGEKRPAYWITLIHANGTQSRSPKGTMIEENGELQGIKGTNNWDELRQLTPTT
jgi:hypothetical protein